MFASLNGYCIRHFQVCLGLHRKSKVMASQRYVVIEGVLHFLCTFFFISFLVSLLGKFSCIRKITSLTCDGVMDMLLSELIFKTRKNLYVGIIKIYVHFGNLIRA